MIKFVEKDTTVGFREIPSEISLCVNISNCQNNCVGCHSSYLKKDTGRILDRPAIDELISKNDGITCFCIMGEGNDTSALHNVISYIKETYPELKIGLYSGREKVQDTFYWDNLDYLKIGPYIAEYGPLDNPNTNQVLYAKGKHLHKMDANLEEWYDITDKFWMTA